MQKQNIFLLKKIVFPGILGNVLEWYDFLLYGFFAPLLAQHFFPLNNKTISLLATFGVFAVGFLMRPLGSLIFGYFGDRLGRKATLVTTVSLMAFATALIGLLPTYAEIGATATVLLTLCRLLQGLALGGEFGYAIYLIEHAPETQRGFYGGFSMFSASLGMLLGSAVSALTGLIAPDIFATWGWRVPFLFGILLAVVGLYFRLRMPETPRFIELKIKKEIAHNPLRQSFKQAPLVIIKACLIILLPAIALYLSFVYLPTYLTTYAHLSLQKALLINTLGMILLTVGLPTVSYCSDKLGRKPILVIGAISACCLAYPLFLFILKGTFISALLAQLGFAIIVSLTYALLPVTLAEMVPTSIRYTAMAFAYNIGNSLFGGTTPLIVTFLLGKTENIMMPAYYLLFAGFITLLTALKIKETYQSTLN